MSDRRLRVFSTVARLLSFTKAADELHMTQPAVTFQVRQLEEQFNTRLFDRTHNKVSLTPAGERVASYAARIFDLYSEMESAVQDLTGDIGGSLTLGASTTNAEYLLPPILGEFRTAHPGINLRLKVANSDGVVSMVEENIIDLGVVEAPVSNRNLLVETFYEDEMVVVVAPDHELAKRSNAVPVSELKQYSFIVREEGSGTREVIADYLRQQQHDLSAMKIGMELGSPEALKGAVEAGMGLSILSRASVKKELKLKSVVALPLDPPLTRPFSFVRQRQKFRAVAMEELLDFAKAYFERNP